MANRFLNGLQNANNFTYTENGGLTHRSTLNGLMDLFAMGGAYRTRSDADCILLFKNAFEEDPVHALKCLFYIRDVLEGQGERRFFRVVAKWLANYETEAMRRNLQYIPEFGRWDDLYIFVGTPLQYEMFELMRKQLMLDVQTKTPSLLAKWLKSENTSSEESCRLANLTRKAFNMSHKEYRKTLSVLRERIRVLERLMSANRWDEIEFDKIPSKAGMIYRNAFARRDMIKAKYETFAKSKDTKVNTKTLYPYEVVAEATKFSGIGTYGWWGRSTKTSNEIDRAMINKYWDNLRNIFDGYTFNGLCMIDTSSSMWGTEGSSPINVAISIGLYCAERAKGPFKEHYISFSSRPQLIKTEGIDFVDKVERIYRTNLCQNTNIEAAFDMLLSTAINTKCKQEDLPSNIIVVSDMEFDPQRGYYGRSNNTLMENIELKWKRAGYKMPNLVYWNVQARHNNIPMTVKDGISYVSGFSPILFQQVMTGKTGLDLVLDKLDSERYACIK